MEDIKKQLRELTELSALAGFETPVAQYMIRELEQYSDDVSVDTLGNVTAVFPGRAPGPSCMVFSHMDELGMIVSDIEPDGYLRFERVGGLPEKVLPATAVHIRNQAGDLIPGIVAVKSHHATPPEEKYKVIPYRELFIDIGAVSDDDVEAMGIGIGSPITYMGGFLELANGRIAAKTLDNRGGCLGLLLLAQILKERPPQHTVYIVASVQEEFNLRGAMVAAQRLRPDCAICYDLALTGDTPDLRKNKGIRLGGGPSVSHFSFHGRGTLNGLIPHPTLLKLAQETAHEQGIQYQNSVMMGGLTDASYVQLTGDGVACIDLQFPVRYTHTPWELMDLNDLLEMVRWTEYLLQALNPDITFQRSSL